MAISGYSHKKLKALLLAESAEYRVYVKIGETWEREVIVTAPLGTKKQALLKTALSEILKDEAI